MFFSSKSSKITDSQAGSVSLSENTAPQNASDTVAHPTASAVPSQPSVMARSTPQTAQPAEQPAYLKVQNESAQATQSATTLPQMGERPPLPRPTSIYARPTVTPSTNPAPTTSSAQPQQSAATRPTVQPTAQPQRTAASAHGIPDSMKDMLATIHKMAANGVEDVKPLNPRVVHVPSMNSIFFADIWISPEKVAFIRDENTKFALVPFETDDMYDFQKALEQGYTGSSSYALQFAGESYRVERIVTTTGVQYNCRKMPTSTPDIFNLGLPEPVIRYLTTLSKESGLILLGGPTGMGKTTTCSALIKKFLENDGGFLYTIEDPPEMPLNGLYQAKNGGLGLCKQVPVTNELWGDALKSALRSKPRYILVGEIRTPETASQTLRAATSGHLVISTIHANSVEDALNSIIKYATAAGLQDGLDGDLLARGVLAVVHQKLEGTKVLKPVIRCAFANPNPAAADQMRMNIREGKINLATLMEAQMTKLEQGRPLFKEI